MARSLLELVDQLSQDLHLARRRVLYEWSGDFTRDLQRLRQEVDALRQEAGLPPSPITPSYPEEEED